MVGIVGIMIEWSRDRSSKLAQGRVRPVTTVTATTRPHRALPAGTPTTYLSHDTSHGGSLPVRPATQDRLRLKPQKGAVPRPTGSLF